MRWTTRLARICTAFYGSGVVILKHGWSVVSRIPEAWVSTRWLATFLVLVTGILPTSFLIRSNGLLMGFQGDCFEVAQVREKYPEKVPFRLTRMLIHAMEVNLLYLWTGFVD